MITMPEISFDFSVARPDDFHPAQIPRYPARADCCVPGSINPWSEYMQAILVQAMMMAASEMIAAHSHINLATTCRTTRMPIHPVEIRSTTVHMVLPHGKTCYITGADDDRDYSCSRHAVRMHRLVKVVHRDKIVVFWGDIIGEVDSRVVVIDLVVEGLGRQRSPAEIVVVLAPRNPGRRPVISRHPNPPVLGEKHPSSIVVDRPAKGLIREPGPPLIRIHPAPPGVGPPRRIGSKRHRLPHESVVPGLEPLTETRKLCKENLMIPGFEKRSWDCRFQSHRRLCTW